jgi:hypothetical protein
MLWYHSLDGIRCFERPLVVETGRWQSSDRSASFVYPDRMDKWFASAFCGLGALALLGWATNIIRRGSVYLPHRTKGEWQVFLKTENPVNYWGFLVFIVLWATLMGVGAVLVARHGVAS